MFNAFKRAVGAAFALSFATGTALGDDAAAAAGKQSFAQCASCHSSDSEAGDGPTLRGILGRDSASVPGFDYSDAMKSARLQWTAEQLDRFIADPQKVVPGTTMLYPGMDDAAQRAALIAYLATLE